MSAYPTYTARHCAHCSSEFWPKYPASQQRFCSRDCVRDSRRVGNYRQEPWTEDELAFLADSDHLSARELGERLGRGMQAVQKKREQIRNGWMRERESWSEDELDVVRATPHFTAAQVAARLPGRTATSVSYARSLLTTSEGRDFRVGGDKKSPHHVGRRRLLAKTCPNCGLFLDAEWWNRQSNGSLRHQCMKCLSTSSVQTSRDRGTSTSRKDGGASARRAARRLQDLSLRHATNRGKEWTAADHKVLANPDLTAIEKALQLGRTYFATHTACQTFGYRSLVGRGDPMQGVWLIQFLTTQHVNQGEKS